MSEDPFKKQELHKSEKFHVKFVAISDLIPAVKDSQDLPKIPSEDNEENEDERIGLAVPNEFGGSVLSRLTAAQEYNKPEDIEIAEICKRYFGNKIVLELGSGKKPYGYFIAAISRAKGCVIVEPHFAASAKRELENLETSDEPEIIEALSLKDFHAIPATIIAEDMLTFLKRIPDNSVSIFSSGVDTDILVDKSYRTAVQNEIARVLSKEGGFINYQSQALMLWPGKHSNIQQRQLRGWPGLYEIKKF